MFKTSIPCDPNLLQLSLDERLSEAQDEALTQHLSQCEHCQRELERLAGRQQDWSKVGSALKFDAMHPFVAPQSVDLVSGDFDAPEKDDEAVADFAVDFLDPSQSSGALGRLGDIDIVEVIGRGGMGIVLKGHQTELNRLVAVKVLAPHLAVSGAARKRFAREAQAAAAILHPNVMSILTVDSTGKLPYLVMPYLAGESLEQRIRRTGALEMTDLLRIAVQAARGLAAAHSQGLIHRDVKPANILLEKEVERVMLTDFGLARAIDDASITRTGLIAGTPQYMSPEQARGELLDARSDLFSLGSVLYTMATGRPPFRAESTFGILRRIVDDEPRGPRDVNPHVPEWLAMIIGKLLAKRPADRYATANEVATLLERCLAHMQQPVSVPLPEECQRLTGRNPAAAAIRVRPRIQRISWIMAAALLAICVLAFINAAWPLARSPTTRTADVSASSANRGTENADSAWDSSTTEWEELQRDGDRFESRASRIWDEEE